MDLIDKLIGYEVGDAYVKMPVHEFTRALFLWAAGEWTRVRVVSELTVYGYSEAEDGTQLDWLRQKYVDQATDLGKSLFYWRLEACAIMSETNHMDRAEFITIMTNA